MGDSGAMFVGLMMSVLGILLLSEGLTEQIGWMTPILILGVPFFDSALVVISRIRRGLPPSQSPGKDHTAHRLAVLGMGEVKSVLLLYGVGLALGSCALLITRITALQTYNLVALLLFCGLLSMAWLERSPYERQTPLSDKS